MIEIISLILIIVFYHFISVKNVKLEKLDESADRYLFWTGGYDSTFRLLQLCKKKINVQPIYIYGDGVDGDNPFGQRNNKIKEVKTMGKIREMINKLYPWTRTTLRTTLYVKDIPENDMISSGYRKIHYTMGLLKKPSGQLEKIARFSYLHKKEMEVGMEDLSRDKDFPITNYTIDCKDKCRIKDKLLHDSRYLYVLKYLRFPICHLSKKNMLHIAKKEGWVEILKSTWTCWFPNDDKPCGKCQMCKERINIS